MNKIIKNILGMAIVLAFTASAHAVTLTPGRSFQLTGGILSTTALSYFTINTDGSLSAVLIESDGDVINIENVVRGADMGEIAQFFAPDGVTAYGNYKDIGSHTSTNGTVSDFAIGAHPVKVYQNSNLFKVWAALFNPQTGGLNLGQRDYHLNIGGDVTSQVPEPMTMSLLGMGLLGGAIRRKKAAA